MNIEELKRRKAELGYTNERIAELSGVPLSTVQKIFAGVTMQPRFETLTALEQVLSGGGRVCEPGFTYCAGGSGAAEKKHRYTLEEFFEITDERRAELVDGEIYYFSSPTTVHQFISGEIWSALKLHITENGGACMPFYAPCDVKLRADGEDIFVPDVLVVCDRKKIGKRYIEGAPDFIVEILSPSTKRRDLTLKSAKYMEAGVKEYWMVDSDEKRIVVYLQDTEFMMHIYGFQDQIPVHIFDGQCLIDFGKISERIENIYGRITE